MNRIINRDILPRISKISKNNKEKDLLSIAYITWLIFIIFALGVVTVNDLKPMFNQLIVNLLNIYYYMEAATFHSLTPTSWAYWGNLSH
ncbi:hypothetical protein UW617_10055, partial [Streptococcus agalactiae]